jgi:hypothetical protein
MFSGLSSGFSNVTNQVSGLSSYFGKKPEEGGVEGEPTEPKPASPVKEQAPAVPEPEVALDADGKPLRYLFRVSFVAPLSALITFCTAQKNKTKLAFSLCMGALYCVCGGGLVSYMAK